MKSSKFRSPNAASSRDFRENTMTEPVSLARTQILRVSVGDLRRRETQLMFSTWNKLRGARRFPSRTDITPRAIARCLRNVSLLAVLHGEDDYELRVVGDAHVEAHGASSQPRRVSDFGGEDRIWFRSIKSSLDHVVVTRAPIAFHGRIGADLGETRVSEFESVFLPLGETDDRVDHVIIAAAYELLPLREERLSAP